MLKNEEQGRPAIMSIVIIVHTAPNKNKSENTFNFPESFNNVLESHMLSSSVINEKTFFEMLGFQRLDAQF